MGEIISHLWLGKEFLDRTQKAGSIKGSTFPEPSNIVPLGQPPIKNERAYFPAALTKFIPKLFFFFSVPLWSVRRIAQCCLSLCFFNLSEIISFHMFNISFPVNHLSNFCA